MFFTHFKYIRPQLHRVVDQIPPNISRCNRSSLTGWDLTHSSWSLSCVNFDLLVNQPTFTGMNCTHQWLSFICFSFMHSFMSCHFVSCHAMFQFNSIQFNSIHVCMQSIKSMKSINQILRHLPKFPTPKKLTSTSDTSKLSQKKKNSPTPVVQTM